MWIDSLISYSGRFDAIDHLMPTIAANARMLGAPGPLALAVQALVAIGVAVVVWRAFRRGVSPRAGALLLVGTFLATPHALNYDLPMTTVAALWYLESRIRATRGLRLSEIVVLTFALVLPFAMLALGAHAPPISWAPELALFGLIAASNAPLAERSAEVCGSPARGGRTLRSGAPGRRPADHTAKRRHLAIFYQPRNKRPQNKLSTVELTGPQGAPLRLRALRAAKSTRRTAHFLEQEQSNDQVPQVFRRQRVRRDRD